MFDSNVPNKLQNYLKITKYALKEDITNNKKIILIKINAN